MQRMGKTPENVALGDIDAADQFHIGGKRTAMALFGLFACPARMTILAAAAASDANPLRPAPFSPILRNCRLANRRGVSVIN